MENTEKQVNITYSAQAQKELNAIRSKYLPKEERQLTDLEKARAIDRKVERKGLCAGLTVGIAGALIMGLGMSFSMVWNQMIPGIIIGLSGIVCVVAAYPVYQKVLQKQRRRAADEIMRLTGEE